MNSEIMYCTQQFRNSLQIFITWIKSQFAFQIQNYSISERWFRFFLFKNIRNLKINRKLNTYILFMGETYENTLQLHRFSKTWIWITLTVDMLLIQVLLILCFCLEQISRWNVWLWKRLFCYKLRVCYTHRLLDID